MPTYDSYPAGTTMTGTEVFGPVRQAGQDVTLTGAQIAGQVTQAVMVSTLSGANISFGTLSASTSFTTPTLVTTGSFTLGTGTSGTGGSLVPGSGFININVSTTASYTFESAGSAVANNGSWVSSSDARLKTNVQTLSNALAAVKSMRGVSYTRIANNAAEIGVIAQEVQTVFSQAVTETQDGTLGVNYGALVGPLIEAVKELAAQVDELRAKIA